MLEANSRAAPHPFNMVSHLPPSMLVMFVLTHRDARLLCASQLPTCLLLTTVLPQPMAVTQKHTFSGKVAFYRSFLWGNLAFSPALVCPADAAEGVCPPSFGDEP